MVEGDILKTMLRTKWGNFAYKRMKFGLINVRATFHGDMDIAFRELINKNVVVYLDDVAVFYKNKFDHI